MTTFWKRKSPFNLYSKFGMKLYIIPFQILSDKKFSRKLSVVKFISVPSLEGHFGKYLLINYPYSKTGAHLLWANIRLLWTL